MSKQIFSEEKKELNRQRMRRNLRIIALLVAAYYFITAFMSYYDEQQREKLNETLDVAQSISDPKLFRDNFNTYLNQKDSILPLANANDDSNGFIAPLSTALELEGFNYENSKTIQKVQLSARFTDTLSNDALVAFKAFIAACENTVDDKYIESILLSLGIISNETSTQEYNFENTKLVTNNRVYYVEYTQGPLNELVLSAQ